MFKPTVNRQKNFLVGVLFVGIFQRRRPKISPSARWRCSLQHVPVARLTKKNDHEVGPSLKKKAFCYSLVTFSLRFLFRA